MTPVEAPVVHRVFSGERKVVTGSWLAAARAPTKGLDQRKGKGREKFCLQEPLYASGGKDPSRSLILSPNLRNFFTFCFHLLQKFQTGGAESWESASCRPPNNHARNQPGLLSEKGSRASRPLTLGPRGRSRRCHQRSVAAAPARRTYESTQA